MAELGQHREQGDGPALTPDGVTATLDELRRSVGRREDSSLVAILAAAESIAARWLAQRERAEGLRSSWEQALRDERSAGVQLDLVLRALGELSAAAVGPEVLRAPDPPRESWLQRLLRPGSAPRPGDPSAYDRPTPATSAFATDDEHPVSGDEIVPLAGEPALIGEDAALEQRSVAEGVQEDVAPPAPRPGALVDATVHLLGEFRLEVRGRPLEEWQGTKSQRVIRYLMAHPRHPVPKDVLIDVFWPEASAEAGRRNLYQAVYMIRKAVRDHDPDLQLIIHDNDAYAVNAELEVWCDTEEFEAEIAVARTAERVGDSEGALQAYAAAERRYRGDLLEDSPYEEWALAERDRLRLVYTEAANRLGDLLLERGAVEPALQLSQRLIRRDPCDEDAHRRAMRCFAATGRRTLVVRQYRTCVDTLARVLALGPTRETTHLYASLIAD